MRPQLFAADHVQGATDLAGLPIASMRPQLFAADHELTDEEWNLITSLQGGRSYSLRITSAWRWRAGWLVKLQGGRSYSLRITTHERLVHRSQVPRFNEAAAIRCGSPAWRAFLEGKDYASMRPQLFAADHCSPPQNRDRVAWPLQGGRSYSLRITAPRIAPPAAPLSASMRPQLFAADHHSQHLPIDSSAVASMRPQLFAADHVARQHHYTHQTVVLQGGRSYSLRITQIGQDGAERAVMASMRPQLFAADHNISLSVVDAKVAALQGGRSYSLRITSASQYRLYRAGRLQGGRSYSLRITRRPDPQNEEEDTLQGGRSYSLRITNFVP